MKHIRFGVEIELDGLGVAPARRIVRQYFEGEADHLGRQWRVERDASVRRGFELVSPPIFYADISTLQEVFRLLRLAGARRSGSTGIHVHLDGRGLNVSQVISLLNIYANYRSLIIRMLDVHSTRRACYARSIQPLAGRLRAEHPTSMVALERMWYETCGAGDPRGPSRYHESRYHEINLNSLFHRGTIEFRIYNSTNHAGKLKSFIVLTLALLSFARSQDRVYPYLAVRFGETLADALEQADEFFALVGLDGPPLRSVREHLRENVRRRSLSAGNGRRRLRFHGFGITCDGGSYADLLDAILDTGFFDLPQLRGFSADVRAKRRKIISLTGSDVSVHPLGTEGAARNIVELLVARYDGDLVVSDTGA